MAGLAETSTDILIIGGGLAGVATARHLARAGAGVIVVERGDIGGAASGANAGSLHLQIPHAEFLSLGEGWARAFAPVLPLMRESVAMWARLPGEIGADLGVALTGGILVARSPAQMQAVARKAAIERQAGLEVHLLDRAELAGLAPYVAPGMIGGAFCPGEGRADPLVATRALAAAARRDGARILTGVELVSLAADGAGYLARCRGRQIRARRVVNAAGADAGRIAAMVGVRLPIEGHPLQVTVTEPLAPLIGHLLYSAAGKLTLKQGGNGRCLIGGGWPSRLRPDGRLAVNPASLLANMATAVEAVPALGAVRALRTWPAVVNGTPDWRPLIGEVPGRPGFFLALFPWMGFTAGPITGLLTAELVLGRRPAIDLSRISALA
ncbi:MAG: sarcosine oxidase subunit beta [Paracoccaceae bacterium]|nr:MAG: FAD-binding oxidoreductase [Alphaproteobacteria bacterium]GIX13852.1 MAG: sarcosine oxidase subunit beta [Paracoccaceae bacterium]